MTQVALDRLLTRSGSTAFAAVAGAVAIGLLALSTLAGLIDARASAAGWLVGAWFWLSLSLGCLAVFMIHQCTGGAWGEALKPALQGGAALLPLAALLFLPLLLAFEPLFPWWPHSEIAHESVREKAAYLTPGFQTLRLLAALAALLLVAAALRIWQRPLPGCLRRGAGGVGLIVWTLASTFLIVDWVMALVPRFYSTAFGFIAAADQWLGALALTLLVTSLSEGRTSASRRNDLAGLLLAAVMFWAYIRFMHYLIIWSGDLPEEIVWYLPRSSDGWRAVGLLLVLTCFAVPFAALLSPRVRQGRRTLAAVSSLALLGVLIDSHWLIMPSLSPENPWPTAAELLAVAGIGGLWLAGFAGVRARWSRRGQRP